MLADMALSGRIGINFELSLFLLLSIIVIEMIFVSWSDDVF